MHCIFYTLTSVWTVFHVSFCDLTLIYICTYTQTLTESAFCVSYHDLSQNCFLCCTVASSSPPIPDYATLMIEVTCSFKMLGNSTTTRRRNSNENQQLNCITYLIPQSKFHLVSCAVALVKTASCTFRSDLNINYILYHTI